MSPPPPSLYCLQIPSSSISWNFPQATPKIWRPKLRSQRFLLQYSVLPVEQVRWVALSRGQVVVMDLEQGGGDTLALHGCFVSVFIWYLAWTHSWDEKNVREKGRRGKWLDGFVYFMFGWIYNLCKKKKKKKEKGNERQTRRNSTHDVKTEVFEWFAGWKRKQDIVLSITLIIMTSYFSLAEPAHKRAGNKTNMLNRFQNDEGLLSSLFEIHSARE